MITSNIYYDILLICGVIIVSYSFGWISKVTKIPSVLLLILAGIGCQFLMKEFHLELGKQVFNILQLLGIVGLIMIVLEAALDLELTRKKLPLIGKALAVAFIALIGSSIALAYIIQLAYSFEFYTSFIYAIPLSIMSSAIIIPSVSRLAEDKKEFMIYESALSDILGIMLFYFAIAIEVDDTPLSIAIDVGVNILITVGLSVILSYLLILIFQRVKSNAHLFLLISILIALYATGKIFHLSSLIVILVFGIMLSNYKVFFSGKMQKFISDAALTKINSEFHLVTLESAFVVRTFFFVVFGLTLDLLSLLDVYTAVISISLVSALYVIRFVSLRPLRKSIIPEMWIAPRGLITVLLFFAIPQNLIQGEFSNGILLYVILLSSLVMTLGMIFYKVEADDVDELNFENLDSLDKELIKAN